MKHKIVALQPKDEYYSETGRESRIVLGSFPLSWEQRKLGELAEFSKGQGYTKSDLRESGIPIILYGRLYTKYQPIIREVDTFADATPQAVFSKGGEVILPSSGETAEDIAIAASVDKSGFLLGGGLNIVLPHKEIDSAFLAIEISFGTPHTELAKRAQGKSVVHLYNEDLKAVEISYPTIAEQKQISTLFDSFDNLITLHQRKAAYCCIFSSACGNKQKAANTITWEQRKLGDLVERVVRKNTNNECSLPLTISAQDGLVDQITYFNNRVASRDVSNYYLVLNGEFAYNKSTSDGFPFGAVKRLDLYKKGVLSTLYIVFGIKDNKEVNSDFLTVFFDTDRWHKGVAERAAEGARNHGLLNISAEDFFDIDLYLPKQEAEQTHIGAYMKRLDNLITLHQRKPLIQNGGTTDAQ